MRAGKTVRGLQGLSQGLRRTVPPASSVMTTLVRSPSCVTVMPYTVHATAREMRHSRASEHGACVRGVRVGSTKGRFQAGIHEARWSPPLGASMPSQVAKRPCSALLTRESSAIEATTSPLWGRAVLPAGSQAYANV